MDPIKNLYSMYVERDGNFLDNLNDFNLAVKELDKIFNDSGFYFEDEIFMNIPLFSSLFYFYISKYYEEEMKKIKDKFSNLVDIEIEKDKLEIKMEDDWTFNELMNYVDSPKFVEQYNFRIVKICNYNPQFKRFLETIENDEDDIISFTKKIYKSIYKSSFSASTLISYLFYKAYTCDSNLSNSVSYLMRKIGNIEKVENIYNPNIFCGNLIDFYEGKSFYGYSDEYDGWDMYPIEALLEFTNKINAFHFEYPDENYDFGKEFDLAICECSFSSTYSKNLNDSNVKETKVLDSNVTQFNDLAFYIVDCLNYLSNKGTCVTNCYQGFLFKGGPDLKFRQYLIDNNYIEGIINLPAGALETTHIPSSILILKKVKDNDKIKLLDATSFFEKKDRGRALVISPNNIDKLIEVYNNQEENDEKFVKVSYEDIRNKNYDLSFSLYVHKDYSINYPFEESKNKINSLEASVKELNSSLESKIKELENIL